MADCRGTIVSSLSPDAMLMGQTCREGHLIEKGNVQDWDCLIAQKGRLNFTKPLRRTLVVLTQLLTIAYIRVLLLAARTNVAFGIGIGVKPLHSNYCTVRLPACHPMLCRAHVAAQFYTVAFSVCWVTTWPH